MDSAKKASITTVAVASAFPEKNFASVNAPYLRVKGANNDKMLRLIYTSDFRGRFRNKLVPLKEYNKFFI